MNRKPAHPAPRKPRKPTVKVSDALVAECLRAKFGNVTEAAKALGVDVSGLRRRVRDTPHLAQVLDEARESIVDLAETMLAVAVRKGEDWAVKRVLESKHAVARGWRPPAQYEIAATAVALTPEERERRINDILGIPNDAPVALDAAPPQLQPPPAP
ncbi:MAG: hypothetical protein IIZ06_01455 [Kiritimatiellae bacterium]|nr:hypothetical protein [Kiritimatiellia bacterium]